jgi:5-methylcytosine-specific restriction endonuclease McrA
VQTWLFQVNPNRFDFRGLLNTKPAETRFLVTRYAGRIAPGDQVFIWNAIGDGERADSGVIAEARVVAAPEVSLDDPASIPFWKDAAGATTPAMRVPLRLGRVAAKREVLHRDWLEEDPVLHDLPIFGMANATNYEITSEHAERLNALWLQTGRNWSYAESVAGLWTYQQTYGGAISKLPRSPVSTLALITGRAVGGAYNKVLNFRHLDPRDERDGLSGAGANDRLAWDEFFDPVASVLRLRELEAEYRRLWDGTPSGVLQDEATSSAAAFDQQVTQLAQEDLAALFARFNARRGRWPSKPKAKPQATITYDRDPLVVAIAKKRAAFKCEVPVCGHPGFVGSDGFVYCEVHHIRPLSAGGADSPDNVACLCPAHHREVHYGQNAKQLTEALAAIRSKAE